MVPARKPLVRALDVSDRRAPLDAQDDVEVHSQLSSLKSQAQGSR
jgi:hypothetical protein